MLAQTLFSSSATLFSVTLEIINTLQASLCLKRYMNVEVQNPWIQNSNFHLQISSYLFASSFILICLTNTNIYHSLSMYITGLQLTVR